MRRGTGRSPSAAPRSPGRWCPTTRVARLRSPVSFQIAARAIRPPSSGNAGTRLNTQQDRVHRHEEGDEQQRDVRRRVAAEPRRVVERRPAGERDARPRCRRARSRASRAGPATATKNSLPGVSVSRLIFITPPKKKRSMPVTSMPERRAASAWPSSCSTIEPKNSDRGGDRGRVARRLVAEDVREAAPTAQKMNRNRIRNQEALTPILIPKIRPSWNELPPSIYGQSSHSIAGPL